MKKMENLAVRSVFFFRGENKEVIHINKEKRYIMKDRVHVMLKDGPRVTSTETLGEELKGGGGK